MVMVVVIVQSVGKASSSSSTNNDKSIAVIPNCSIGSGNMNNESSDTVLIDPRKYTGQWLDTVSRT